MHTEKVVAHATPMPDDEGFGAEGPLKVLEAGKTLMKAGTPFVTAISVQKPRDLDKIVMAIDREAEYAGDSFYYGWTDKKGNRIEGPSIGLANSLAREWTNCAVTVDFQENIETFVITPRFIDIEKGFQMERVFRQRKNVVQGNFDPDRKLDMALQIGQSKAIRNVVVNAVPRWLVERAMEKAKEAVVKGIDVNKLGEYKDQVVAYFKAKGVTPEQLVTKAGRPMAEWTTRDIAGFKGDKKALENGEVSISELFPPIDPKKEVDGPLSGKTVADAIFKDPSAQSDSDKLAARQKELDAEKAKAATSSGAPSPEEQERIRKQEEYDSKAMKCAKCSTFATNDTEEMKAHLESKHPNGNSKPPAQEKKGGGLFK